LRTKIAAKAAVTACGGGGSRAPSFPKVGAARTYRLVQGEDLVPTVAPTAVAALKIGILVPYTESSIGVDIGLNQKRAADLYLKRHAGQLGGRTVNLVYSSESVEAAINKVKLKTLVDTEKVELLLGGADASAQWRQRSISSAFASS